MKTPDLRRGCVSMCIFLWKPAWIPQESPLRLWRSSGEVSPPSLPPSRGCSYKGAVVIIGCGDGEPVRSPRVIRPCVGLFGTSRVTWPHSRGLLLGGNTELRLCPGGRKAMSLNSNSLEIISWFFSLIFISQCSIVTRKGKIQYKIACTI